jgi:hypothetical protein
VGAESNGSELWTSEAPETMVIELLALMPPMMPKPPAELRYTSRPEIGEGPLVADKLTGPPPCVTVKENVPPAEFEKLLPPKLA